MRIVIVVDDSLVGVDGVFRTVDLTGLLGVHALHYDTQTRTGWVETKSQGNTPIDPATFDALYGAFVGAWTDAAPPGAPPTTSYDKTQFTSLEFLDRFTGSEQLAVVTATLASPVVKLWYDKMLAASFVDLADPRTEGGLDALVLAGLLAPDRKAVILTPEEVPV